MKISQNEVISLVLTDFLQHYINPSNFVIELALMEFHDVKVCLSPETVLQKIHKGDVDDSLPLG